MANVSISFYKHEPIDVAGAERVPFSGQYIASTTENSLNRNARKRHIMNNVEKFRQASRVSFPINLGGSVTRKIQSQVPFNDSIEVFRGIYSWLSGELNVAKFYSMNRS